MAKYLKFSHVNKYNIFKNYNLYVQIIVFKYMIYYNE